MTDLPRRILVCRIDNLGDVVMVLPALRWLKTQHPALRIEMVVRDYARALVLRCPWVDRVWSPDELLQAAAAREPVPDAVFHLQSTRALLRACAAWGIALRVGNLLRSAHWGHCNRWVCFSKRRLREHESALAWRFFAAVFKPSPTATQWTSWLQQDGWLRTAPRPPALPGQALRVLVHPGSNGNGRQWPLRHMAELVRALHARGHAVAVTGTAADRPGLEGLLSALPQGVEDLVSSSPLDAFIDRIAHADCLVASGTGPLHIAGACGTHAVGIFPPLQHLGALRWRPIGPWVTTLQTVQTVQTPQTLQPSTRPGGCSQRCTNLDCRCMAEVTPQQVLAAVLAPRAHSPQAPAATPAPAPSTSEAGTSSPGQGHPG